MRTPGRPVVTRGAETLSAVAFGLLAAVSAPGLPMVLLVAAVAVAIGVWARGTRTGLLGLAVVVVVSMGRAVWVDGHWVYLAEELPSALLRAGVPWLAAVALRQYVSLGRQADRQRELRRRERAAELERRSTADRLTLAQSLHDDLGHSLSLVALTVGRLELDPTLPETSRAALFNAREEIGRAVERLGSSVVTLRSGGTLSPPRPESVEALVRRARDAGARIDVTGLPDDERLDVFGRGLVARILTETITNANRHAPGEAISVEAADTGSRLHLRITNGAFPRGARGHTSGTGLAELAQTLEACGGELEVTRSSDRFVVTAVVPATGRAEPHGADAQRAGDLDDDVPDAAAIRRSRRRRSVAAVVVIVLGLAAGEAASFARKSRAVLSTDAARSITVGAPRQAVLPLLPEHELPLRRGEVPEPGCSYYAATADSFDDAAGDLYEVCFDGESVSRVEYIRAEDR